MRGIVLAIILFLPALAMAEKARVLVLPFATNDTDAIAKAVQASVVADLSRQPMLSVEAGPAVADSNQSIPAARSRHARFVVTGAYQAFDGDIRFTGQVLDLSTGNVIGGLKATGTMRDLFGLEDTLAGQAQRAILTALNPPPPRPTQPTAPTASETQSSQTPVCKPVPAYTFEGSDLQRSLNSSIQPSILYDYTSNRGRYNYYYSDPYGGYFGDDRVYTGYYRYPRWGYYGRWATRYTVPRAIYIDPGSSLIYSPSSTVRVRY